MKIIDDNLMNELAEEAKKSTRLRKDYNFHQMKRIIAIVCLIMLTMSSALAQQAKNVTNNTNNMKSFKSTAWLLPPLGRRTLAHLQDPVLIIGTYKLMLLFLMCCLSSCSHHGQTASKEGEVALGDTIEWIVEELSKETEFDATEGIGFAGERTHQYDLSDSLWHVATTEQLAYLALSHPSPVVRLSASYGLMEQDPHIAAEIAIEGASDTAMLEVIKGCIGGCRTVSEDRIRGLSVNRRWYGLSVEDSIRLDSLVLYKPYFDRYDRGLLEDFMIRMTPRPEYYERVKELFQKEHCIYALMGIAKYQRADDLPLMTDMAQKAIRLAQEKEDKEMAAMESDGKEETLEVIEVVEEEEGELEFRCTPPQEPSENDAGWVSYVIIRCASFWPDEELLRAVQPLRHFYPHFFDSFHIGNQREDSK